MGVKIIELFRNGLLAGCSIAALMAGNVVAQDAKNVENDTSVIDLHKEASFNEKRDVDLIIVSATRRSESMQKVPIAISVLKGSDLEKANLNGLREISSQIPSFNFRQAASYKDQALFLRGLGTSSTSPGVEPSVATVIDGVVLGRQGQASLDLLDVDRVEVLRGPQGTLFGRNSSAGVLNIVTKKPTDEFRAYGDLGLYEGNETRVRFGVSGGLIEGKLAANFNFMAAHFDGNVTNVYNNEKLNGYDYYGARTKWVYNFDDNFKALLVADYSHNENNSPNGVPSRNYKVTYPTNAVTTNAAFANAYGSAHLGDETREVNINFPTYAIDASYGTALELEKKFGDFTITSISAYRKWENTQFQDQDKLPNAVSGLPQQNDTGYLDYEQYSQELRLASPKTGMFDYIAGIYLFKGQDKETYSRDVTVINTSSTAYYTGTSKFGVTNKSAAIFGEGNIHFTEKLNAIIGARITHDEVNYYFTRVSSSPVAVTGVQAPYANSGKTDATKVSSRAGLQYNINPNAMTYFTYSKGYKGPAYSLAFSALAQDSIALKPEISDDFEIGIKSKLFSKKLFANIAIFYDKVDDYQVPFFDVYNGTNVTRLINAGKVYSKGIEADLAYSFTDNLSISGALTYNDAKIDRFICPAGASTSCNVNGKPLTYAPKWKSVARVNYKIPLGGDRELNLGADATYRSETQYSINQTSDTIQPEYTIINATIAYKTIDGLQISIIGKNLGDKSYSPYLQQFGQGITRFVPRDDKRYFGMNIRKDF